MSSAGCGGGGHVHVHHDDPMTSTTETDPCTSGRTSRVMAGGGGGGGGGGGASSRLLNKLNEALTSKKFYEAHQLVKTLNFRYTASKNYEELEGLLQSTSEILLDNKQGESGADVAIMLAKLYLQNQIPVNQNRMDNLCVLFGKIVPSPERMTFICTVSEWAGNALPAGTFHSTVAQVYISEHTFAEAWKHLVRLNDGKEAGRMTMSIIRGSMIHKEEIDLVVSLLVVGFLAAKRISQAEEAYGFLVKDIAEMSPLLNGVRYLVAAAKMNNATVFKTIKEIYGPSFSREQHLNKLVTTAGKTLFNLQDPKPERQNNFMPMLFNSLFQPEQAQGPAPLDQHLDFD